MLIDYQWNILLNVEQWLNNLISPNPEDSWQEFCDTIPPRKEITVSSNCCHKFKRTMLIISPKSNSCHSSNNEESRCKTISQQRSWSYIDPEAAENNALLL